MFKVDGSLETCPPRNKAPASDATAQAPMAARGLRLPIGLGSVRRDNDTDLVWASWDPAYRHALATGVPCTNPGSTIWWG